ncbi:hypothetical protein GUJ93_ZPchr0005g15174 [Zizania palustris]|uniref:Uncharacterized protein n=1 Tax=Zizania palustris TaxID=103762 RepID=A0A8J5S4I1_ZIZPA|nr:hypothetical protein GUJ93_ZPchr0005g15174 [Zizania palustris]
MPPLAAAAAFLLLLLLLLGRHHKRLLAGAEQGTECAAAAARGPDCADDWTRRADSQLGIVGIKKVAGEVGGRGKRRAVVSGESTVGMVEWGEVKLGEALGFGGIFPRLASHSHVPSSRSGG